MADIAIFGATQPFTADDVRWAYAVGAPYHVGHGRPIDGFPDAVHADSERTMLTRDWGIDDRASLIDAMSSLGSEGHRHRLSLKLR